MTIHLKDVERFISKAPTLDTSIDTDSKSLTDYIQEAEALLAKLPKKSNRSEHDWYLAEQIVTSCRQIRSLFIDQHADELYATLTEDLSQYHRLSELVFKAAEDYPGLVPTRSQMEAENEHIQAHKDGLEIDQGIFFRGLLRSPTVGTHLADAMLLPCPRALSLKHLLRDNNSIDLGAVLYERRLNAAHLTFNNQQHLNAEDNRFVDDMETAVDLALLDERVKVCVLRGGEMTHHRYKGRRVFCAGINLKDLYSGNISFIDFLLTREFGYISKMMHGLLTHTNRHALPSRTIQKPWIAAVDSFAIGGGMQVLLVCDKVIATNDAYFSLPAAQEGIIPGLANLRLARIAGSRLTRQIILSGRKILASSMQAQCLCDEVVSAEEMDATIEASISELSRPAVLDNRKMLNLAEEPRAQFIEYMADFAYVQSTRLYSADVLTKIGRWSNSHEHQDRDIHQ